MRPPDDLGLPDNSNKTHVLLQEKRGSFSSQGPSLNPPVATFTTATELEPKVATPCQIGGHNSKC